jgi:hypothetical protein
MERQVSGRPAGVTIVAVLAFAMGSIDLIQGLRVLGYSWFGAGEPLSSAAWIGWATLFFGFLWIVVGGAFFTLQRWAWLLGVIVVGISLIEGFLGSLNGWQLGDMLVAMIVPLVILVYMYSEKVKAAFGIEG